LPVPPAKVISGQILFKGEDILKKSKQEMRKIRGAKISMIFQDPMTSLNPVMTVSEQIEEAIGLHNPKKSRREIKKLSDEMLETVGIKAERSMDYPHQFSGGMKQRVVIAMALACNPELIIADEPTTALDVTIQAQVLDLMKKLKDKFNTSMIMITHDLGVVAEICDYVAIMYSGEVVEHGTREHIFHNALHPYTKGLFACIPNLYEDEKRLKPIKGLTPDPVNLPKGCKFHPRCPYAMEICSKESPKPAMMEEGHMVKCHLYKEGMADGK
jgi:peptide/nickel transport system ATP-binding protein